MNGGFADGANVEFKALGWEDTLATTGRRNQSVINAEIDRCDVFILVMHRRWGQEAPDTTYSSYTEEEFYRALERFEKTKAPEIFVFFKRVSAASEGDAGPQLLKVLDFRKQLEDTRQIMYRVIDNDTDFLNEVDTHLRAYAKGELTDVEIDREMVLLPSAALEEVQKAKEETIRHIKIADAANQKAESERLKLEEVQLEMAEEASEFSKNGMLEHARQKFVKLVSDTSNLRILFLAYEFFYRTGDLNSAEMVMEHGLDLSGPDNQSAEKAAAYGNLGLVYKTRGDLDRAESMYEKSIELFELLGSPNHTVVSQWLVELREEISNEVIISP